MIIVGGFMKKTIVVTLINSMILILIVNAIASSSESIINKYTKTEIINPNLLNQSLITKLVETDRPFPYQILFRINLKTHSDFGIGLAVVFDSLLWVSAGGRTSLVDPNWVFIYNLNNHILVDSFQQPTLPSGWGWRDMCFDGQYVWGSIGGQIDKIDPVSHIVVGNISPGTGLNPHRGLASDYDSLFATNWDSPVWKFSFDGTNEHSYPNARPDTFFGLAYDQHGYFWSSSQNGTGNWCGKYTTEFNLIDGHTIAEIPGIAGGCEMWKDSVLMYLSQADTDEVYAIQLYGVSGVVNDVGVDAIHAPAIVIEPGATITPRCRVRNFGSVAQTNVEVTCIIDSAETIIYYSSTTVDIDPGDTTQAAISPVWLTGPEGNTYVVTMFTALPGDENLYNDTLRRTSTTTVLVVGEENEASFPTYCNIYPNPISDFARINFSVKKQTFAELTIYDITGKIVRNLISGLIEPGEHYAKWDGTNNNGIRVVKGTYFYRLILDGKPYLGRTIILK